VNLLELGKNIFMLKKKRKKNNLRENNLVFIFKNGSSFKEKNVKKFKKHFINYYSFIFKIK
jgi:hypothetical protein